jgi:S1-C subfamily serine protease
MRRTTRSLFMSLALSGLLAAPMALHAAELGPRPHLGVAVISEPDATGLTLGEVSPEGPGGKAGLKQNDRIVQVDGKEVKTIAGLQGILAAHKPGDPVAVKVVRDGKEETFTVTLGEAPKALGRPVAKSPSYLGVHAQTLTAELKKHLELAEDKGALVTDVLPNSPAARAGLQDEDVITHVGDTAVTTPEELRAAIQKARPDQEVTLKVVRGKEHLELKAQLQALSPLAGVPSVFPEWPDGFGPLAGKLRPFILDMEKVPALEKKVQELEQRMRELEQHRTK